MSWESLSALLFQCMERGEVPRPVLVLGAVGTLASIIQAIFTLRRWWRERRAAGMHRAAAALLRREGEYRASLGHCRHAMANFNMSIRLNANAGESHYQRGLLHETLWLAHAEKSSRNRAIADWKRCCSALPGHREAVAKLTQHGALPVPLPDASWLGHPAFLRIAGALTVLAVLAAISLTQPGRGLLELALGTSALR